MAKFRTEKFVVGGSKQDDVRLVFNADVNVDSEGEFTCTIPENIAILLTDAGITLRTNGRRNARLGFFCAKTFEGLKKLVCDQCSEYVSKKEVGRVLMLRYCIESACSYCMDADGNIFPNRGFLKGGNDSDWKEGNININAGTEVPYGIRLYVRPVAKINYLFGSGKPQTVYEELRHLGTDVQKTHPNLHYLSGIVGMGKPNSKLHEIEYNESVGEFFVNFFKSICKLNENLKHLLEPDKLKEMIETGKQFLLS